MGNCVSLYKYTSKLQYNIMNFKAGDSLTDVSGYCQQNRGCLMQLAICVQYEMITSASRLAYFASFYAQLPIVTPVVIMRYHHPLPSPAAKQVVHGSQSDYIVGLPTTNSVRVSHIMRLL